MSKSEGSLRAGYVRRAIDTLALMREWLRDPSGKVAACAVVLFVVYLGWLFFGGPAHRVLIANLAGIPLELAGAISERGLLSPDEFIPLAESTGLIVPLGRWVLREACRQGAPWHGMLPTDATFTVAVNISGHQLHNAELTDDLVAALERSGNTQPPSGWSHWHWIPAP